MCFTNSKSKCHNNCFHKSLHPCIHVLHLTLPNACLAEGRTALSDDHNVFPRASTPTIPYVSPQTHIQVYPLRKKHWQSHSQQHPQESPRKNSLTKPVITTLLQIIFARVLTSTLIRAIINWCDEEAQGSTRKHPDLPFNQHGNLFNNNS